MNHTNITTFIGLDNNRITSLKEYGFVCKAEKSDQFLCIYKSGSNYDYGFLCESEITNLLSGDEWIDKNKINSFYEYCGITSSEFNSLPFHNKAHSLIQYFGSENIMGMSYDPMTLTEAVQMMRDSE